MSVKHYLLNKSLKKSKTYYDRSLPKDYASIRKEQAKQEKSTTDVDISFISLKTSSYEYLSLENNDQDTLLIYIHGGGFIFGSSALRRSLTTFIVKNLKYNVASINYRLAPEYKYPTQIEDCLEAYIDIIKTHKSKNVFLIGESAGGNLVLALAMLLRDKKLPQPKGLILFSPVTQFSKELPSYKENAKYDNIVTNSNIEILDTYLKDVDLAKAKYAEVLYQDLSNLPPCFITASDKEVLLDDARFLYKKLLEVHNNATLKIYHGKIHAFQIVCELKEARKAVREIKPFVLTSNISQKLD